MNLNLRLLQNITCFLSILICSCAYAQPQKYSSTNRKAINWFEDAKSNYEYKKDEDAYKILKKVVEEDPQFFEAWMLLADVSEILKKPDESIEAFKKAIVIQPQRFPPIYYNLAGVQMQLDLYEDAITNLEKFLQFPKISPEMKKKGERRLGNAKFSSVAMRNPVPFNPINMGEMINSIYNEYHPSLTVDEQTLIYTRMRPADGETDNGGSQVEEDFYWSIKDKDGWKQSISLGPPINTHGNEGAHCISPDGRYFFFTGCERKEGLGSCDLYVSERQGNKWTAPKNLGQGINSEKWDAQPTISADGQTLVFVSSRAGGKGQADLWMSKKTPNGQWQIPVNMGDSLNTEFDENGPFLHPDGKTLYFTSSGHPGMGGKDIFYSKKKADGNWSKPINLGYPINTRADEIHMVVSADGKKGYFSSDRTGGSGKRDLYYFDLYEGAQPQPVTFLRGKVRDKKTAAYMEAAFEIIDLSTGETRALSRSDKQSGEFLVSLPAGSNYALNVSAPGYLFYSENYKLGKSLKPTDVFEVDIQLNPIETGQSIVLKNIFFETGSFGLKNESQVELNKLVEFLSKNPTLVIEIGGHTDNVGNDQANMLLSENRAKSVVDFLVAKGIFTNRLQAKGYGETIPKGDNTTEKGREENRRTEFRIVKK
jgi:outer membrane protein OmpA-like peptidoglycan-associated protein/Tol biopolymer transport system component